METSALIESSPTYTREEYLEFEVNSEQRHEYIRGEVIAMTGGTPNHNQIVLNLGGELNYGLRQHPYRVFVTDQRLWIAEKQIYTYPDIVISAEELELQEGRKDTLANAIAIAEVLSASTRHYDKDAKFAAYRTLPSFQEYLLIDQYVMHVEQYFKTDAKHWTFTEYDNAEDIVTFKSVSFQISLADLYNRVELDSTK
ncbi:Uma2 family endonuclease [Oscillatoria sp. FACHB-1406]|uniref:Uma2 family endonuclease n=1 Tax=Oscillatoria sp. FACHB-1406 TaxID=2692846 RepID=UPI001684D23E|nr:Uma2 family endonuclease [Oscillatoria sp. FACHB-1406]MBD2577431.1 Uma2 family endonuclease [Oscillatoria sp. FACHB-1406]